MKDFEITGSDLYSILIIFLFSYYYFIMTLVVPSLALFHFDEVKIA